ncbi:fimbrial protein [Pseudomonas sp. S2_C03]
MKKQLIALSLGLSAALAGTSAFANSGVINFEGRITSATCPIEIVNPEDGSIGNQVKMGTIEASRFTAIGQEFKGKSFGLRVTAGAGCGFNPADNVAKVVFNGNADSSGDYFAVTPTSDGAKNVVISLHDISGPLKPGTESAEYALNDTGSTDMIFNAYYRSTAATVTAGTASADIQFIVAIN